MESNLRIILVGMQLIPEEMFGGTLFFPFIKSKAVEQRLRLVLF